MADGEDKAQEPTEAQLASAEKARAHAKLEKEALLELTYRRKAVDLETSRKADEATRKLLGVPTTFPSVTFEAFREAQSRQTFIAQNGLPDWTEQDQYSFFRTYDKKRRDRIKSGFPEHTPDEDSLAPSKIHEGPKFNQAACRAIIAGVSRPQLKPDEERKLEADRLELDRKALHLPQSADPLTVLDALKKQQTILDRESLGLPPGPQLTAEEVRESKKGWKKKIDSQLARTRLHLPESCSDSDINEIADKWKQFELRYSVQVVHLSATHKLIYAHSPNVQAEQLIGEFEAPSHHFTAATNVVSDWIEQKKLGLQKKFGCTFTPEGLKVPRYRSTESQLQNGQRAEEDLISAEPTVTELIGLEHALNRLPGNETNKPSANLKVAFVTGSAGKTAAYYVNGQQTIYFEKDCANAPATQDELSKGHSYPQRPFSMEAIAVHELAHYAQDQQHWFTGSEVASSSRSSLHWVSPKPDSILDSDWYLQAKDGNLYRHDEKTGRWLRFDGQGHMLNLANQIVDRNEYAAYLTNKQMLASAAYKPVTNYFDHPQEMDAEARMLLELGGTFRKQLFKRNASLYYVAKREDQEWIDSVYGVAADNKPLYIRDLDGMIKKDNAELEARIQNFEYRLKMQAKTK